MLLGNKVTVFGGTGFVGKSVLNELSKAGYETKVVVRRPERFRELLLFPNTKLHALASYEDGDSLNAALADADTVINLTVDRSTATEQVEQDELANVAQKIKAACESNGVKRVLSLSQAGASNDAPNSDWFGVLGEVENLMHHVANAESTVFRANLLIGEGDQTTQKYLHQLSRFRVLPVAQSDVVVQPLWIKDFAQAVVSTIKNRDFFGAKVDMAGEERLTVKQLAELTAELTQKPAWLFGMCQLNAKVMAALGGLAPFASVDQSQLVMLTQDMITDEDFTSRFGFAPSSLEWAISTYAAPSHLRERYNYFRKEAGRDMQEWVK